MSNLITSGKEPKKRSKKKWFVLGLGLAATSVLTYFRFDYWRKNKHYSAKEDNKAPTFTADAPTTTPAGKPKAPIKTPSKTAKTNKTAKTTAKQEPPKQAPTQDKKTQAKPINPVLIARGIWASIIAKDFKKALFFLKTLKNTNEYSIASKAFESYKVNGLKQTLVNGMLNSFKDATQKQLIREAFSAMGLKYDGKKWSLSGVESQGKPFLITTKPTQVWKNPKTSVHVPLNMVLGKEITRRGNYTVFENDKQFFLVQSNHVGKYNSKN